MSTNMLKGFWPSGPHDQTTPRANAAVPQDEANPFDSLGHSTPGAAGPGLSTSSSSSSTLSTAPLAASAHAPPPLSSAASNASAASGVAPPSPAGAHAGANHHAASALRTPVQGVLTHAATPTTSLSTTAPDFTMTLPPAKPKTEGGSGTTSGPTRNTAAPRGHLTVKLIEARNLLVTTPDSQPYAVVSFEQNEFIGREPIDESEADSKGTAMPTDPNGTSARSRAKTVTKVDGATGAAAGAAGGLTSMVTPGGSEAMRKDVVWRHEVTFDVTHSDKPILLSVYDRLAEEEGFLGMKLIRPRLVHGASSDQWYSLVARHDDTAPGQADAAPSAGGGIEVASGTASLGAGVPGFEGGRGEVRLQITYERLSSRKRLSPNDFEYLRLIGRGTFGRVFQVRKKDTRRIYAMKVLSKREIALKKEVTHTMGERKILEKSLDCPFLVGLKFSFQSEHELFFVTDYKSGGELFWHLQREGRFTEERARFYIAELVLALEHLHKYDIVYRDLKPENILLDATGHVALCDFGLSKPDLGAGQLTNTFCGTTEYLAPEVLLDESGYSKLVDFWSLGVLLFEMCCGWSPFYAEDTQQMYRNICFGKIKFPRGAIGDDGKQFVKGLLNRNPRHRLGAQRDAQDLKEHAFFREIDFDALAKKQLTPPFKPLVDSDESVANFDPEFTETDLSEVANMPEFDEVDIEGGAGARSGHNGGGGGGGGAGSTGGTGKRAGTGGAGGTGAGAAGGGKGGGAGGGRAGGGGRGGGGGGGAAAGEDGEAEDEVLSSSVQQAFRGFSFGGRTYDASSFGGFGGGGGGGGGHNFGGRRGSGGLGLAGASLGMSRMQVDDATAASTSGGATTTTTTTSAATTAQHGGVGVGGNVTAAAAATGAPPASPRRDDGATTTTTTATTSSTSGSKKSNGTPPPSLPPVAVEPQPVVDEGEVTAANGATLRAPTTTTTTVAEDDEVTGATAPSSAAAAGAASSVGRAREDVEMANG